MMTDPIRGIDIAVSLIQEALLLLDGPENVASTEHLLENQGCPPSALDHRKARLLCRFPPSALAIHVRRLITMPIGRPSPTSPLEPRQEAQFASSRPPSINVTAATILAISKQNP